MIRVVKKVQTIVKPICKVVYYLFLIWIIGIGTVGTYSVFKEDSKSVDMMTLEEKLELLERTNEIDREIYELYEGLGYKYSITVYRFTKETAYKPQRVDVIASIGSKTSAITKRYWRDEETYEGYKELSNRLSKEGTIYIGDVRKEEKIYIGNTKKELEASSTKVIYGMVIKREQSNTYGMVMASSEEMDIEKPEFYFKTRQTAKNIQKILENREDGYKGISEKK